MRSDSGARPTSASNESRSLVPSSVHAPRTAGGATAGGMTDMRSMRPDPVTALDAPPAASAGGGPDESSRLEDGPMTDPTWWSQDQSPAQRLEPVTIGTPLWTLSKDGQTAAALVRAID